MDGRKLVAGKQTVACEPCRSQNRRSGFRSGYSVLTALPCEDGHTWPLASMHHDARPAVRDDPPRRAAQTSPRVTWSWAGLQHSRKGTDGLVPHSLCTAVSPQVIAASRAPERHHHRRRELSSSPASSGGLLIHRPSSRGSSWRPCSQHEVAGLPGTPRGAAVAGLPGRRGASLWSIPSLRCQPPPRASTARRP